MAKTVQIKPEEEFARAYADRLILEKLTELQSAMKLSELAEKLQGTGIGLAAIRSLLASNPAKFAYAERRWIPAARVQGAGRPFQQAVRLIVDRFGGPMPIELVVHELRQTREGTLESLETALERICVKDPDLFLTENRELALSDWVFVATDEALDRALDLNQVPVEEFEDAEQNLAKIDWSQPDAIAKALSHAAPIRAKTIGAVAWRSATPDDPKTLLYWNWRDFAAKLLGIPGYVLAADGVIYPEADTKKWVSAAVKLAEKLAPTIEIEDAQPIEVKETDVDKMVKKIVGADASVTATQLLEEFYEITPSVKTFPDDMANLMTALKARADVWWVGGDRFRKPGTAPDFIESVPELFQFVQTDFLDDEGEQVDVELNDEGLSSTLRKLLIHPQAMDVLDEDILPAPKTMPEQIPLVLKTIHRELGTFPMCQIPNGWLDPEPKIQELLFVDGDGRELQVWANMEARLLFNLIDWFFEQPIESGAAFTLTRTAKPNVFEFEWREQPDPVVFITTQRMEQLRAIQENAAEMSTLEVLMEVMGHWPKGADFLTILWEVNVVRRVPRRLVASLLSSYACFYQRSGSPVWHFDNKKVDQGFDKSKRKFVLKK